MVCIVYSDCDHSLPPAFWQLVALAIYVTNVHSKHSWLIRYDDLLIDGTAVQVTIPEMTDGLPKKAAYYQVLVKNAPVQCSEMVEQLTAGRFASATQAIRGLETRLNRTLYQALERGSLQ